MKYYQELQYNGIITVILFILSHLCYHYLKLCSWYFFILFIFYFFSRPAWIHKTKLASAL